MACAILRVTKLQRKFRDSSTSAESSLRNTSKHCALVQLALRYTKWLAILSDRVCILQPGCLLGHYIPAWSHQGQPQMYRSAVQTGCVSDKQRQAGILFVDIGAISIAIAHGLEGLYVHRCISDYYV